MRFDEPRHLTALRYRHEVAALWPCIVGSGAILSVLVFLTLWRQSAAGRHIAPWQWLGAVAVAPLVIGGNRFALSRTASQRRWIEIKEERVFFAKDGSIKRSRVLGWSLTPDKFEPNHMQLKVTYKFGRGRNHWVMLLDDATQIAQLREALGARFPELPAEKTK